jgi:hypothetical protein
MVDVLLKTAFYPHLIFIAACILAKINVGIVNSVTVSGTTSAL